MKLVCLILLEEDAKLGLFARSTVVSWAERGASGLIGLPMNVSSALVWRIQYIICSGDTMYDAGFGGVR